MEITSPSDNNAFVSNDTLPFVAVTSPTGCEGCIQWSGGGNPAEGAGPEFNTMFSTTGLKTVVADNDSVTIESIEFNQSIENIKVFYVWGGTNDSAVVDYSLWSTVASNCDITTSQGLLHLVLGL